MSNKNTDSDRDKIAARLKEARTLAGLSQEQVATILKVQRPAISEIESGKRKVTAEEIIRFATLYKVDTGWLLLQDSDENERGESFKYAARELGKLSQADIDKVLQLLKILPK